MKRVVTALLLLVFALLAIPASAQYRLSVVVTERDPKPGENNVFVRFEIPESDEYKGNYRLEITRKGPWKINLGHDFFSPQECTGKEVLLDDSDGLPWWGDIFDPTLHYFFAWNARMELGKLPWETCTLNAIAYREINGEWKIVKVQTVKLDTGHRHRIRFTGQTETGWYDEPPRMMWQVVVYLVKGYSYLEGGSALVVDRSAFQSFGCKTLSERVIDAIKKEATKLIPGIAGHFSLKVGGGSQLKCRTRTYDYCCFHYNEPDTWVIDYKTVPQVFTYEAKLFEERIRITLTRGSNERKLTLCRGFIEEDDITGDAYYNSHCDENKETDVELPTVMWTDVAKNKRWIHRHWLNHKTQYIANCAEYIRPCECQDQPTWGEGF